jgi:hypothetical protein
MFVICRECGAPLRAAEIEQGTHECTFEQMVAFQTQCARIELERGLAAQVAVWEREPRLSRRIEFARYLRDRDEYRSSDRDDRAASVKRDRRTRLPQL